jgi:cysteine-rich repeat protein
MNELQPGSGPPVWRRNARAVVAIALVLGSTRASTVRADVSLTATTGFGAPGSTVTLTVDIASSGGSLPSTLNFDLVFDAGRLSVLPQSVTCGAACAAAEKMVQTGLLEPGRLRVIVFGLNATAIPDGELVGVPFTIAAAAMLGLTLVEGQDQAVADSVAELVPTTFTDGAICIGDSAAACAACGDGSIDSGEECDDGNTVGGDGCSVDCTVEGGWTCSGEPSVCNVTTSTTMPLGNGSPDCGGATAVPDELWPPDHRLARVSVRGVVDPDGDDVGITVTAITQDEPLDGTGVGDACPDGDGVGTSRARVRAERGGRGTGRVYRIAFMADDGHEGRCTGIVTVCVPHDRRPGSVCADEGLGVDSTGSCAHSH